MLNDHYNIIAIFSNINGTPRLIIDNEPSCRIDSHGRIYTQKIINEKHELFPWYDHYYDLKIYTLTETDEIAVAEEYLADGSWGSDAKFIDITGGENTEITKADF